MTDMTILARFPGIDYATIAAEVAREIAFRRATYPGLVAKGRMTA